MNAMIEQMKAQYSTQYMRHTSLKEIVEYVTNASFHINKTTISKEEGRSSSLQFDSIEKLHALSRHKKEYTP